MRGYDQPRRSGWLPSLVAAALVTVASAPAWAGGSTSGGTTGATGSDTDQGASGSGGSTTGMGDGTTTIPGDTGMCGECTEPGPLNVEILAPGDGEVVASPLDVRVSSLYTCYCDTCGCFQSDPQATYLEVDGATVDSCTTSTCNLDDYVFTVELEPGTHELRARTSYDLGSERFSPTITVTVQSASTGTTAADGTAGPGETGQTVMEGEGCACTTGGRRSPSGLPWLLGAMVIVRRHRR